MVGERTRSELAERVEDVMVCMGLSGSIAELSTNGNPPREIASPGTVLFGGQFTITRPVTRNGLGRVYGAKDSLGRDVILTVCSDRPFWQKDQTAPTEEPGQENRPTRQMGFVLQEANCLSEMDHPNIVPFHSVLSASTNADPATGADLGSTLREVIDDPNRRLKPEHVISIAWIMLDALRSIHALGLLHGDVSVDTILLNAESEPFLVDLGAVLRNCGNPPLPPDEAGGAFVSDCGASGTTSGPWCDLQGLAAALHHAVTGKPFAQTDALLSDPAATDPVPKPFDAIPGYPSGFLESIDTALGTPPPASFQSADEWIDVLDGLLRQKDSNMKLLQKALGLRTPNRTARSKELQAAVVDDLPNSPDADAKPTIGAEDLPDISADQPLAVSLDASSQPTPLQQPLILEGSQMAVDLSGLKEISGFIAGCLVDCDSGLMLASELVGKFDIETAAAANVDVVRGKQTAIRLLGLDDSIEDILITLGSQVHLIRPLEGAPNLFLYAALERKTSNLGMARLQVKKVEQSIQF